MSYTLVSKYYKLNKIRFLRLPFSRAGGSSMPASTTMVTGATTTKLIKVDHRKITIHPEKYFFSKSAAHWKTISVVDKEERLRSRVRWYSLTHSLTHLVARRRTTTRSFHSQGRSVHIRTYARAYSWDLRKNFFSLNLLANNVIFSHYTGVFY